VDFVIKTTVHISAHIEIAIKCTSITMMNSGYLHSI